MSVHETAELCDRYGDAVQVANPVFRSYGGNSRFHGPVCTVRVFEDFLLVRQALEGPGDNRVLVVDGNGHLGGALLGGKMAEVAVSNRWSGLIINGCVRDVVELAALDIGIAALNSTPARSAMEGAGERDVPLEFAGVRFEPGGYAYVDEDGIVVSKTDLDV